MPKGRRKRASLSSAEALRRIEQMVRHLEENVGWALAIEAAAVVGNELVRGQMKDVKFLGANCYNTISQSLNLHLALVLARAFDPGSPRYRPNKRDTASIPHLVRLMAQKRCRSQLLRRARGWTPHIPEMAGAHERACDKAIDAAVAAFDHLKKSKEGRRALFALREFRNKKLAHSLLDRQPERLPLYSDLYLLTDAARDVCRHSKLAVEGTSVHFESVEERAQQEAQAFWRAAFSGVLAA